MDILQRDGLDTWEVKHDYKFKKKRKRNWSNMVTINITQQNQVMHIISTLVVL